MPLLALKNVCKTYNTQSEHPLHVLKEISFSVETGDFISIMGPSGSGKSTLLNMIGLLDVPDCGSYVLNEREITTTPRKLLPNIRSHEIGFIFQNFNLLPRLSVYQNILLPMIYAGVNAAERHRRVLEVLALLQLSEKIQVHPYKLSGGEQQRVAIARAMVNRPKLILADEPTGNLDSDNGLRIMRELTRLNEDGTTIVLITHDSNISAFARVHYTMKDGTLTGESHVGK